MTLRAFLLPSLVVWGVLVASGCPRTVGKVGCENVRDCATGELCQEGECVPAAGGGCTLDTDCNVNAGEVCNPQTGQCDQGGIASGCLNTSECPIDQFCNTSTGLCADLAPGFCRNDGQCTAPTGVCSAASENVPGRCVECITSDDCGGQQCVNPGVCSDVNCPPNSTPINGECRCNPGFQEGIGGGCVAVTPGEGEGEGEGEPGEGEGEPGPELACDPQLAGLECVLSGGPFNACGDDGQCTCDEFQLFFSCLLGGADDYDLSICDCVLPGEGEGEGEGEGDPAPSTGQPCSVDSDCDTGAVCVTVNGEDSFCKEACATDADCENGVNCEEDVFAPGEGVCADFQLRGEPCQGSAVGGTWTTVDQFCLDPPGTTNSDAFLLCISGTCQAVCDGESNPGGQFDCPSATTCGPIATPSTEFGEDVAICQ